MIHEEWQAYLTELDQLDRLSSLLRENELLKAENAAIASQMLNLQQDCIKAEQRARAWARLASFAKHASDCAALDGDDCTCGLAEAKRAALSPQAPQEVKP
jgi:hypothetical protein